MQSSELKSGDDEFENFSKSDQLAVLTLLILTLMMCGVILGAIVLVIIEVSRGKEYVKPDWEKFSVKLIPHQLNVTDAARFCENINDRSRLAFPSNLREEEYMHKLLIEQNERKGMTKTLETCSFRFFLGLRKCLDEEWVTANGDFVFGPDFLPNMYASSEEWLNERCTALAVQQEYKVTQLPCDHDTAWRCIVCEHPCTNNETSTCYNLWNEDEITNRTSAIEYCQLTDVPGELVGVSSTNSLKELREGLRSTAYDRGCNDQIAISNKFTFRYESIYEEYLSYMPRELETKGNHSIHNHCIVVNMRNYRWEYADCNQHNCFICKISDDGDIQKFLT